MISVPDSTQGIKSFRAIQSTDPKDDKQWLTFWLLFALFDLVCYFTDFVGWLVPLYDEVKVGVLVFFGVFGGAHTVYPLLEPLLLKGEEVGMCVLYVRLCGTCFKACVVL
jgi:hypothetical protein